MRLSLALRSDLPLGDQIGARGATWLDRQIVARDAVTAGSGFGLAVRHAIEARGDYLVREGLARREGQRLIAAKDLIETLKGRDLVAAAGAIAEQIGRAHV